MSPWSPFDRPIVAVDHWDVPSPWQITGTGKCRTCRSPIAWAKHHRLGLRRPFDPSGTDHISTCPNRDFWTERAKEREAGHAR